MKWELTEKGKKLWGQLSALSGIKLDLPESKEASLQSCE
jgi:hypothetical protein